jgi:hypothetical protein
MVLDNGTRAAAIAGVSPTLDYRFAREKREIETVSLTDKLTYTGGNGTFVGSDRFIQPATTNVPRFDHDPLSRQSLGLLSEASGENVQLNSENLAAATWSLSEATLQRLPVTLPNGASQGLKFVESTATSGHSLNDASGFTYQSGASYNFSFFAKAAERRLFRLIIHPTPFSSTQGPRTATFNALTGAVTAGGIYTSSGAILYPNGWYRFFVSATAATTGSGAYSLTLSSTDSGTYSYAGDGSSGMFFWGVQVTPGPLTSYIPTGASAVTRTADSAVIDGTGVLTGTYTLVEKPAGCAVVSGTNINLQPGFTAERVMVFPAALDAGQITAIRGAM